MRIRLDSHLERSQVAPRHETKSSAGATAELRDELLILQKVDDVVALELPVGTERLEYIVLRHSRDAAGTLLDGESGDGNANDVARRKLLEVRRDKGPVDGEFVLAVMPASVTGTFAIPDGITSTGFAIGIAIARSASDSITETISSANRVTETVSSTNRVTSTEPCTNSVAFAIAVSDGVAVTISPAHGTTDTTTFTGRVTVTTPATHYITVTVTTSMCVSLATPRNN